MLHLLSIYFYKRLLHTLYTISPQISSSNAVPQASITIYRGNPANVLDLSTVLASESTLRLPSATAALHRIRHKTETSAAASPELCGAGIPSGSRPYIDGQLSQKAEGENYDCEPIWRVGSIVAG